MWLLIILIKIWNLQTTLSLLLIIISFHLRCMLVASLVKIWIKLLYFYWFVFIVIWIIWLCVINYKLYRLMLNYLSILIIRETQFSLLSLVISRSVIYFLITFFCLILYSLISWRHWNLPRDVIFIANNCLWYFLEDFFLIKNARFELLFYQTLYFRWLKNCLSCSF